MNNLGTCCCLVGQFAVDAVQLTIKVRDRVFAGARNMLLLGVWLEHPPGHGYSTGARIICIWLGYG
jgi:hypothetical protein